MGWQDGPPDWMDRAPPPDGPVLGQATPLAPVVDPTLYIDRGPPKPTLVEEARRLRRDRALQHWHTHPSSCPMSFVEFLEQEEKRGSEAYSGRNEHGG